MRSSIVYLYQLVLSEIDEGRAQAIMAILKSFVKDKVDARIIESFICVPQLKVVEGSGQTTDTDMDMVWRQVVLECDDIYIPSTFKQSPFVARLNSFRLELEQKAEGVS